MKLQQILLGAVFFLTACSSPKYAYHFDQYDYNSGKKIAVEQPIQSSPLKIDEETMVASTDKRTIEEQKTKKIEQKDVDAFVSRYKSMTKAEQKEFRSELKKEIKTFVKKGKSNKKADSIKEAKAIDPALALAAILGVAGLVFIILAGVSNVFWVVGAIAIVAGAVFFVKWVADGNG